MVFKIQLESFEYAVKELSAEQICWAPSTEGSICYIGFIAGQILLWAPNCGPQNTNANIAVVPREEVCAEIQKQLRAASAPCSTDELYEALCRLDNNVDLQKLAGCGAFFANMAVCAAIERGNREMQNAEAKIRELNARFEMLVNTDISVEPVEA